MRVRLYSTDLVGKLEWSFAPSPRLVLITYRVDIYVFDRRPQDPQWWPRTMARPSLHVGERNLRRVRGARPGLEGSAGNEGRKADFILSRCGPRPSDPTFQQTVILMLPPTQMPLVAGIIVNKPTNIPLPKLFPRAPALKHQANAYFGGPVEITEPSLVMRASEPTRNVTRLLDNVYVSTDPDSITKLIKDEPQPDKNLRVFFGRAQWTLDQLHAEILAGAWYVVPAKADLVFSSDPGRVWRLLVERAQLHEVDASITGCVPLGKNGGPGLRNYGEN